MKLQVGLIVGSAVSGFVTCRHLRKHKAYANSNVAVRSLKKENLSLQLVQIVFRHGARTPLAQPPYLPYVSYSQNLIDHASHTFVPYLTKRPDGTSFVKEMKKDGEKGAINGQLTAKGAQQMYELGCYIRQKYISELGFISKDYTDKVYVRSTEIPRAIESARSTLAGLFPDGSSTIPIEVSFMENELLYPNFHRCRYLTLLSKWAWTDPDLLPVLQDVRKKVQKMMKISENEKVHIVTLRDYIFANKFHGLLPPEYDLDVANDLLEQAAIQLMDHVFSGYGEAKDTVLKLGIGPLLGLFLDNMNQKVDGSCKTKLHLYSGHDTSLMPLLHALNINDSMWPPYAANITLELYKDESTSNHFVRVLYLNEEKTMPGCGGVLCPLDQFKEAISGFLVNKDDYHEQCGIENDRLLQNVPKV